MTTIQSTTRPLNPSSMITFRRTASGEWTRLWTLRSTWLTLLVAAGLMMFVGAAAGAGHDGREPAPIWRAAQMAMMPGQFAFLVVVLLAVTGEYATGAIHSTLQWVPRRKVLFAARALVPVAFVTVCAVLFSLMTGLVAWAFLGDAAEVVPRDIALSLGRIAIVVAFGGFLSSGLGMLLRSTAGTLTAIFLLMIVLVVTLGNSGVSWLVTISDRLPGRAIVSMLDVEEVGLTPGTIAVVMLAWTAAALLAGGWSLLRRDAT